MDKAREDAKLKKHKNVRNTQAIRSCITVLPHRLVVERNTQEGKDLVQALRDPAFVTQVLVACANDYQAASDCW